MMNNTVEILDQGFECLVEKMGVVNAEQFIALIKRDDFDYTVWQRDFFDKMDEGEFLTNASTHAKNHPHKGSGQRI